MGDRSKPPSNLPPEQEAIRAKCVHPTGTFVEFPIEDVETSIPARFEKWSVCFHTIELQLAVSQLAIGAKRGTVVIVQERGGVHAEL